MGKEWITAPSKLAGVDEGFCEFIASKANFLFADNDKHVENTLCLCVTSAAVPAMDKN